MNAGGAVGPYDIDPSWPTIRHEEGDQYDVSDVEECEVCHARAATHLVDLWGCEGWACGYCR